jgi:hypothetical protein
MFLEFKSFYWWIYIFSAEAIYNTNFIIIISFSLNNVNKYFNESCKQINLFYSRFASAEPTMPAINKFQIIFRIFLNNEKKYRKPSVIATGHKKKYFDLNRV